VAFASGATPTVNIDYSAVTSANLPASDPAAGRFGFRRTATALTDCEIHCVLNNEADYGQMAWDKDLAHWNVFSGSGTVPTATSGSGGATKGKLTVDSDYGLVLGSGVLTINLASTPGLQFDTGSGIQVGGSGVAAKIDSNSVNVDSSGALVAAYVANVSASVSKGDPCYWSGNDTVAKSDTTYTSDTDYHANVVGLAAASQVTVGQPVVLLRSGVITALVSGASAGQAIWLKSGGGVSKTIPGTGERLIRVGFAKNATDINVEIQDMGMKA
jgi:hypothetical protein